MSSIPVNDNLEHTNVLTESDIIDLSNRVTARIEAASSHPRLGKDPEFVSLAVDLMWEFSLLLVHIEATGSAKGGRHGA